MHVINTSYLIIIVNNPSKNKKYKYKCNLEKNFKLIFGSSIFFFHINYRVMHTKQQVAIICCVKDLYKQTDK